VKGGEAVRLRPHHDLLPAGAAFDARVPGPDLYGAQPAGLEQQGIRQPRRQRAGVVTARLRRYAEAGLAREVDGRRHVRFAIRHCDGDGMLVDGELPRLPCSVPGGITGTQHEAAVTLAQGGEVDMCPGSHRYPSTDAGRLYSVVRTEPPRCRSKKRA
jgi:hypothetical protein